MKKSKLKSAEAAVTLDPGQQSLPQPTPAPKPQTERRRTREEFIEETIALWSRRAGREIGREEALKIIEGVADFVRLLNETNRASSSTGEVN